MRKTSKLLACLLVVCMLVACLPMGTLFASAETMSAEPSKNSTPGAIAVPKNDTISIAAPTAVNKVFTKTANGYTLDLTDAGYATIGGTVNAEYAVNVLKNTFAANDTWTFEFDVNAGAAFTGKQDYRVLLCLGDMTTAAGKTANGFRIMVQGSKLMVPKAKASGTGFDWKTIGDIGMTIPNGGKIHFSFTVREFKYVDVVISNSTKTYTYTWDVAADWGANFTPNLFNYFTLNHKNIYMDVSNINVTANKTGVTAPTAENNLVLTKGKWVSGYSGKVYPFTASKDSFYINTTVAGQVASGSTAYTTSFDACPFGVNNAGYTFDATKSYVISANVARANASNKHPDTGAKVVSRLFYYFGKYNNKDLMIYFDKDGYHWCKEGYKTYTTSPLLQNVPLNEYARITAYVSPFEIEIYVNGEFLTSMALENPSLYVPNFLFRSAGTEAWFKDVAIWENTANGDAYYDVLSSQYNQFAAPGVRTDLDLTALGAALDAYKAGSANTALVPFVTAFAGATKTVVNNYVADGTVQYVPSLAAAFSKSAPNAFVFDANIGNAPNTAYTVSLFKNGSPMVAGKTYVVEGKVAITNHMGSDVRFGLQIGRDTKNNKDIIFAIQNNSFLIQSTGGWKTPTAGIQNGLQLKTGDDYLYFKYTFSNTGVTFYLASQSGTVYVNKSFTMAEFGFDTNSISFDPKFYLRTAKFSFSNLYVGESVEASKDALSATVTEYAAKDTDGFTAETVKNFTDALAAANTILGAYTKYSNAEINAAAAAVVSAFGALEEDTIKVPVGDIEIDIAPDAELPVKTQPEGTTKFILGWKNPDGTAYTGTTYVEGLVADYVETLMMTVKYQLGTSDNAIRYIASVDETERYAKVGWAFSLTNANPEIGGANVVVRDSRLVYNSVLANGVEKSAADIYGGADYAQYLYVFEITDIPEAAADSIIYVRPYVEMNDGTIVYGEVSTQSLAGLKTR